MQRFLAPFLLLGLLLSGIPSTAHGFFDVLGELGKQLQGGSAEQSELDELMQKLQGSGETSAAFKDVESGSWYEVYVVKVAEWGIASGYKDKSGKPTGTFGPADPVTLGEILKMAFRSAGVDETKCVGTPSFAQAKGHWAEKFVVCAEDRGVRLMVGNPHLDRPATRAEVLAIIHDAFGAKVPLLFSTFADTANHTYEADIAFAASRGVVSGDKNADGTPKGTFRPNDPVKRAEAAKIIYNTLLANFSVSSTASTSSTPKKTASSASNRYQKPPR